MQTLRRSVRWLLVVGPLVAPGCSSKSAPQSTATPSEGAVAGDLPTADEVPAREGYGFLYGTDITDTNITNEESSGANASGAEASGGEPQGGLGLVGGALPMSSPPTSAAHPSKDEIKETVQLARPEVGRCYQRGLERDPQMAGRVAVRFVIEADGSAQHVAPDPGKTTLSDAQVVDCVLAVIKKLRFPEPEGGRVFVTYPFRFVPAD